MSRINEPEKEGDSWTKTTLKLRQPPTLERLEARLKKMNAKRLAAGKEKWNRDQLADHILTWGLDEWDAEDKR